MESMNASLGGRQPRRGARFVWGFLGLAVSFLLGGLAAAAVDECLVIGAADDPAAARRHFERALSVLASGSVDAALDAYEEALVHDRSVLALDDRGLGRLLLERIRSRLTTASPTIALLCRVGYLENIMAGSLPAAIAAYERAARESAGPAAAVASREAERLRRELEYVRRWQAERRETLRIERLRDLESYRRREEERTMAARRAEMVETIAEIAARLEYLAREEAELLPQIMADRERAEKYYRLYYRGSEESRGKRLYQARYNYSRADAHAGEAHLSQVRAEISGLRARLAEARRDLTELDRAVRAGATSIPGPAGAPATPGSDVADTAPAAGSPGDDQGDASVESPAPDSAPADDPPAAPREYRDDGVWIAPNLRWRDLGRPVGRSPASDEPTSSDPAPDESDR